MNPYSISSSERTGRSQVLSHLSLDTTAHRHQAHKLRAQNSFPGTKLNDGGWKLHYCLRLLECHFLIVHTLSSLEGEPHPSQRLTRHHAPGTFCIVNFCSQPTHYHNRCLLSLCTHLPTAKRLSKNQKCSAFLSSITSANLFLEFWHV